MLLLKVALSPKLLWEFMLPAALPPLPCFLGNAETGTEASGRVSIELHTCRLQEGPERESAMGSLRERWWESEGKQSLPSLYM